MAKGKKEDPNKVAQRKAARVAFVKSNPQLAPEVARKRYYVQTRAAELEAAGKPVDRAALRKKFETGGVTREGFYTPADINRIAARNASLADSKVTTVPPTTTTTGKNATPSTSVVPPKNTQVVTPTTSTTLPKTSTTVPSTATTPPKPISGTMPRIADRVNQTAATVRAMSPDVAEAKAKAPKPNPADLENQQIYDRALKKYGNAETAMAVVNLIGTGGEKTSKLEDALFGRGVSWKTAVKEQTGIPQIGRGIEGLKSGEGAKGKVRGALDFGLGAFQLIGNLALLKGAGKGLNAKFGVKTPVVAEGLALPAAGKTGKFGRVSAAEEARLARLAEERTAAGWGAGEVKPTEAPAPASRSRQQVAAERKAARDAERAARNAERASAVGIGEQTAPSLHEVKQAELQKMVDETPLNIEKPTTTKGKGKNKGKNKVDKLINEQGGAVEPGFEYGPTMPREMKVTDVVETPKPTKGKSKKTKTKVEVKASEVVDDFEFDASTMEMGSTERMAGDAYLYNPADDIAAENLASIKAKQEPVLAPEPAVTEKPKGKGKSKKTTQVEIKAEEPAPKPVKKKQETKVPRRTKGDVEIVYPEGSSPQRQTIATSIEVKGKQGTIPGQTPMGQALTKNLPVEGEIVNPLSARPRSQREIRAETERLLREDPFGTGAPRDINSPQGRLRGETEQQIVSKGGRPKKVQEIPTTPEQKAQANIEMMMSGTSKQMSVAEIKAMAFEDINRISRWLTKKRMQSVAANPEAPSTVLDNLREIIGQAKASRMIENAAEFEATGGQQKYFDMVTNPRSSAKRPTAESRAAEAEGKLISDINDINAKTARSGSKSGPTPESNKRLLSTHMPTIERLEPKVKSGTATDSQMMELLAAYESMMRGVASGSSKESWYKKIKWLQGMMEKY